MHLFERLDACERPLSNADEPLPFLRLIEATPLIPRLAVNANSGFALTMAVHASFIPLIRYLLQKGAVIVAVRRKYLKFVRIRVNVYAC